MDIDIRETGRFVVDNIYYADNEYITYAGSRLGLEAKRRGVDINADGVELTVLMDDIDNLTLALKKAQEIWGI